MPIRPRTDENGAMEPVLASLPRAAGGRTQDEYDALADLFLSDDEPVAARAIPGELPRGAKRSEPSRASIELLVQGHLPVRAAPWASQYARLRAAALRAPVGLIRMVGGQLAVEVFGTEETIEPTDEAMRAVERAASASALLIVQLDEVHQAAMAADPRLAAVTVLAGTNEAAVVATYRTLKGLAGVLAPAAAGEAESPPTDLQVALVTNDDADARDALERLRRAASVFLDRPLALAATVGKIVPTGAIALYRGESSLGPGRLMDLLAGGAAVTESVEPRVEPKVARTPQRAEASSKNAESLARFVEGLRSLPIRCPDDAMVELALDAGGALHLLRADSDSRGVERLIAASGWAMKHAALIAAAGCGIDAKRAPVLHLFTAAPKSVRHLFDADMRVHLLAPVGAEWFCTELN